MQNISDVIEQFILEQLQDYTEVNLSRNELASFFNCAPSQINYVLSTRFTNPKGFIIESRRGGGGYIKLTKVDLNKDSYIEKLICDTIKDEIDYNLAVQLIDGLLSRKFITEREHNMLIAAISNKSLSNPIKIENKLRANILKNVLINIVKGDK